MHSRRSGKISPRSPDDVWPHSDEIYDSSGKSDDDENIHVSKDTHAHVHFELSTPVSTPQNEIAEIGYKWSENGCTVDAIEHLGVPDSEALYGQPFGDLSEHPSHSPRIYSAQRRSSYAKPRTHRLLSTGCLSSDIDTRRRQSVLIQNGDAPECQNKHNRLFAKTLAELRKRELLPSYER
jgi:hypothetical protein